MLFSSINLPSKKAYKNKPTTVSEKKLKKYLPNKTYIDYSSMTIRDPKKTIKSECYDSKRDHLINLNYLILTINNCPLKLRKSKVLEYFEVPEDRKIVIDTKNILLKAKLGEDYTYSKNVKKIKNKSILEPQSVDKALYRINFYP